MGKQERLQFLEQLMKENPEDPFPFYAWTLESSQLYPENNLEFWQNLAEKFSDYLPLYYQWGLASYTKGKLEEAISQWEKGLQIAQLQKNKHTEAELRSAITNARLELMD